MRVFTVHYRPASQDLDREVVLVKEGFCWPAFLFTFIWSVWRRLWLVAGLMLAAEIAIETVLMLSGVDSVTWAALYLGYRAIVGFGANDWRRRRLARAGYREAGVVAAANGDAALRRFFDLNPELLPDGRSIPVP